MPVHIDRESDAWFSWVSSNNSSGKLLKNILYDEESANESKRKPQCAIGFEDRRSEQSESLFVYGRATVSFHEKLLDKRLGTRAWTF